MSYLTLAEISLHGMLPGPSIIDNDKQPKSGLFIVPNNVTVMFRGTFGFCQYTIPGVIDSMMGRSTESFTNMLKRHNSKKTFYGPLYYYNSGSKCINFAFQDDPKEESMGDDSFAIKINRGKRIGQSIDIESSGLPDNRMTITTICDNDDQKKYFKSLKNIRKSFCKAQQNIKTGPGYIYLVEIINLLITMYNINENNQLIIYVSSCQPIDDEWDKSDKRFKEILNTAIYSEKLGFKLYNPIKLTPMQKGVSLEESEELHKTKHDHNLFYGDTIDGYMYIPDSRGVDFIEMFPESVKRRRTKSRKKSIQKGGKSKNIVKVTYKGKSRNIPKSYIEGLKGEEKKLQIKSFFENKDRPKSKSFKSKRSGWVKKFEDKYDEKITNKAFIHKNIITRKGQKLILDKGRGAYYSSGSRPNQTSSSWAYARLASVIMNGPARKTDMNIWNKYKVKRS